MAVQAYKADKKFETFSYLPALNADQVRRQIAYAISQGWNPSVEHAEKGTTQRVNYWYMWKLPLFGEQSVDISYGRDSDVPDQWRYFETPTPGSENTVPLVSSGKSGTDR